MILKTVQAWIRSNHYTKIWSGSQRKTFRSSRSWSCQSATHISFIFAFPSSEESPGRQRACCHFTCVKLPEEWRKIIGYQQSVTKNTCLLLYFVWENRRHCSLELLSNTFSPSACSVIVHLPSDRSLQLSTAVVLARHTNLLSRRNTCGELSSQSPRIYHQEQVFSCFLALEISWLWGCCLSSL